MRYVLITPNGRQYMYYLKGCAEIFQNIYGGEIHEIEVSSS